MAAGGLYLNQPTAISTKLSFFSRNPYPVPYHPNSFFKTSIACSLHHQRRPDYVPGRISDPNYVRILDTTLRDGEQAPGASLTSKEKLTIARQLAKLKLDIIDCGFPSASNEEFEAVKIIAKEVGNDVDEDGHVPVICGVARCNERDIKTVWEAVKYAKRPRIITFIATSDIHMEYKLRKTKLEVIEIARSMVKFARSFCHDVAFCPEDASRTDREFLYEVLGEVIKSGASTVIIADTVGTTMPTEFGQLIADIKANTIGIENVIISAHCHNDLGLSTANTIAGVVAGARQVEVTINGIGERAGNASLEEVVMALKCHGEHTLGGLYTGINTRHIVMASKMVEEYTGLNVQPHKAIVGANALAHESGILQDGMLKHKGTYGIISPEDIGLKQSNEAGIVLGKLSGCRALKDRLKELGYELDDEQLGNIFWHFKAVAETKKKTYKIDHGNNILGRFAEDVYIITQKLISPRGTKDAYKDFNPTMRITDDDLITLVSDEVVQPEVVWKLLDLQVTCGTLGRSTATVKLIGADGQEHVGCAVGTGPVDSAYKAVDLIEPGTLLKYSMNAVTQGIDAIATTRILIRGDNHPTTSTGETEMVQRTFSGTGAEKDIVVSSVNAYIGAIIKMLWFKDQLLTKNSMERSTVLA